MVPQNMILVCPECSTQYEIPSLLPDEGAKVRCTSCSHVWMATNDDVFELSELQALEAAKAEAEADNETEADETVAEEPVLDEFSEIEPVSPIDDVSVEDIDFMEVDEEVLPEEDVADVDGEDEVSFAEAEEDNSQDDIDSLFDEAIEDEAAEDQSQDDIDSLFDEVSSDKAEVDDIIIDDAGDEENSQDDIDGLFDEASIAALPDDPAGEENSQDDIDGLFDEVASEMASSEDDENSQGDIDGLFDEDPGEASRNVETAQSEEYPDPFDSALAGAAAADEGTGKKQGALPKIPFYKRLTRQEMIGWGCYGLGILVVASMMIYARVGVVKMIPAMSSVYAMVGLPVNVRGLMFSNIQQNWEIVDNSLHLKIEGEITNLTNKYKPLPPLVFGALSEDNREVFRWVMKVRKKPLLPGEKALFKAMVPVPPEHSKHLLISFQ